jgi:DNA-binding NarL/FixJ family response regulator
MAHSEPNPGSGEACLPPCEQPVSIERMRTARWQVLVVDDDEWTRQMLRDILEAYPDIEVVGEAADGQEAVSLATAHRPDLIIMDIALPYLNGIDATHRIKKALPQTVIIGMSGNYIPQVYTAMRTAGAVFFLCKDQVLTIHDTIIHALNIHALNRWEGGTLC